MKLTLTHSQLRQMLSHAEACLPEEACGLIGGLGEQAHQVVAITNELHSPVRFRMDAREQLAAFLHFEEKGLELIAIFHSHPNGPPTPSPTDLAEFTYPGTLYCIIAPHEGEWRARVFTIDDLQITEHDLHVIFDH